MTIGPVWALGEMPTIWKPISLLPLIVRTLNRYGLFIWRPVASTTHQQRGWRATAMPTALIQVTALLSFWMALSILPQAWQLLMAIPIRRAFGPWVITHRRICRRLTGSPRNLPPLIAGTILSLHRRKIPGSTLWRQPHR